MYPCTLKYEHAWTRSNLTWILFHKFSLKATTTHVWPWCSVGTSSQNNASFKVHTATINDSSSLGQDSNEAQGI